MNKTILISGLLIIAATGAYAQKSKVNAVSSTSTSTTASASAPGHGTAMIQSGTQITGQLQSGLDAKTAKVGDQVILKTTSAVKQNGHVVVQKGSKLIGHVTDVQQKVRGNASSKIGVLFDRLEQDGSDTPITAMITSITQARASASANRGDDEVMASGSSSTRASGSTRSSGGGSGGLLGGVTNTVGGVVNATTQTVGGVADTAGQTLGATTQTLGGTLQGIQITQSTDASASGGSTLSLTGGNLKLDKGATFNLSISQASSVKAN